MARSSQINVRTDPSSSHHLQPPPTSNTHSSTTAGYDLHQGKKEVISMLDQLTFSYPIVKEELDVQMAWPESIFEYRK